MSFFVSLAGGKTGQHHIVTQLCENRMPQGGQFIHTQCQRQTQLAPLPGNGFQTHEGVPLELIEIRQLFRFTAHHFLALVAGNESAAVLENVDGQMAVVSAALTDRLGGLMAELFQLRQRNGFALGEPHGMEGGTVSAHQTGNGRANHRSAQLHFKGAEHGIVQERAALHHDIFTQLLGGAGANDLIQRVFHYGNRQTRGNILHGGAVFLALFHGRVHKHGAAAAQIHRSGGMQTLFRKGLYVIAHALGKGFDKGTAAGGASLVEHNGVNGAVANFETLNVLSADVQNKIHIGLEIFCGGVVGDGFHNTLVNVECVANQFLAVAGGGAAANLNPVSAQFADFHQLLPDDFHRVAPVGAVIGVQQLFVLGNQGELCGGGAAVDAQPCLSGIAGHIPGFHNGLFVPLHKCVILCGRGKQRRQTGTGLPHAGGGILQILHQSFVSKGFSVGTVQCSAQCHGKSAVFREHRVFIGQPESFLKPFPQTLAVVQRTAQEHHLAVNFPALCQTGNGLAHHGLINAGGYVGFVGALIQQGLNIGFCEHAAAGGDGVQPGVLQAGCVHFFHGHVQQYGHLVDECTGAAGTSAVHALVRAAFEEDDLCVFSAQLNDHAGVRLQHPNHLAGGIHFLHKGNPGSLCQTQSGGAGNGNGKFPAGEHGLNGLNHFQCFLAHLRQVALILFVNNFSVINQYNFCGGGADVHTQSQPIFQFFRVCNFHGAFCFSASLRQNAILLDNNALL